jgi:hypothetical protein
VRDAGLDESEAAEMAREIRRHLLEGPALDLLKLREAVGREMRVHHQDQMRSEEEIRGAQRETAQAAASTLISRPGNAPRSSCSAAAALPDRKVSRSPIISPF